MTVQSPRRCWRVLLSAKQRDWSLPTRSASSWISSLIPLACPDLSGNELKYLSECIQTGYVTHAGRFEGAFEKAFSERFKTPCIATSSGTGALHLALLSLGVGPGDEVLVPDLTFGATASVVLAVGARPVFVDIDPSTWGMDKNRIFSV